jgi:hypothetical protein
MTFKGHYEASKDDCDCVAIFDGTSFTLEQAAGQVKSLRCVASAQIPVLLHSTVASTCPEYPLHVAARWRCNTSTIEHIAALSIGGC